jgi:protein-disulfide isomerase
MKLESIRKLFTTQVSILITGILIASSILWGNYANYAKGSTELARQTPGSSDASAQPIVDASKVNTTNEPFIGSATAPVTVAYWFDYQCPYCQRNEETVMPQIISNYVDTGKVKIVFKDYQFLGPDSQSVGIIARAVWDVAPGKFYQWHKAIFDNQGQENTGWATKEKVMAITKSVLGEGDTAKVAALADSKSSTYTAAMSADAAEANSMGVNGTPGFIIGKQFVEGAQPYAVMQQAIESALQGK